MIVANIQPDHQIACDGRSVFQPLAVAKDHFQFHEIAEILDTIEMNPGLPDDVKPAGFSHDSALAMNQTQHCPRGWRVGDGNSEIIAFSWPRRVFAEIVNEFSRPILRPKLEPTAQDRKKYVFLP